MACGLWAMSYESWAISYVLQVVSFSFTGLWFIDYELLVICNGL